MAYFDSQPLPVFHRQSFLQTLGDRDPEVLFAILALALRYTDKLATGHRDQEVAGYVEASRNIVSKKVFHGTVELSTIQALCLLSLVDFTGELNPPPFSSFKWSVSNLERWEYTTREHSQQSGYELGSQCRINKRSPWESVKYRKRRTKEVLLESFPVKEASWCRFQHLRFHRGRKLPILPLHTRSAT